MDRKFTIEQARSLTGLTQEEMAEKLGVSASTYYKYEKYKTPMRMDTAYLFSKITSIGMDDIIFLPRKYGKPVQATQ